MKIAIVLDSALNPGRAAPSNFSHTEFLSEARRRFPQPSEFLQEFLSRYEQLAEQDIKVENMHFNEAKSDDITCPGCGMSITVEVEFDLESET